MSKRYGLIIPGSKKEAQLQPKANFTKSTIFGSDSDSDDAPPFRKAPTIQLGNNEKRQAKKIQEKALEEDPTIFQYDELYDEIEKKRDQQKIEKSTESRKPKYISRLLQCAERRKLENERRLERLIQKERELEGEQFKDKDAFVTSSYRKKLEELRKAEEREKLEEYLEAIGDVTKQQNLDGFYRHLYEQKLGTKDESAEKDNDDKKVSKISGKSHDTDIKQSSSQFKSAKLRTYRKRRSSIEDEIEKSSKTEEHVLKKAHLQSNIDADSDFSIDSSSSSEDNKHNEVQNNQPAPITSEVVTIKHEPGDTFKIPANVNEKNETIFQTNEKTGQRIENQKIKSEFTDDKSSGNNRIEEKSKVSKQDIWKKRTVGEVFEAALQRYYERKAARNG